VKVTYKHVLDFVGHERNPLFGASRVTPGNTSEYNSGIKDCNYEEMSYDQKATGGTASFNDYLRTSAGSYDKDILIYCVSQLMAKKNAGEPLAQTLHLNAHDLLVWTNRETSGDAYRRLKDAFERLSGTRITTNIKAGGEEITEGFGLIESWRVIRETKSGRMSELRVRLSDWVYKIIQGSEVLTLSRDYFRLRKPTDRRIYELARKHCGEQDEWKISLELLQKKSGASSYYREFKSMIREVVENDHLPDYQVALEDEMVIFRNRMSFQPKVEVRYPVLDPEAYHDAKLVAPGYDIYYLESEWREMWVASGMPALEFPGKAFVGFCKKRYQMKPNP
jgi:hypothetical protein